MNEPLLLVAVGLLWAFSLLSAVDGLGIHLWRLRLHARPQSWREHVWHTLRAALFVPILLAVFAAPTAGLALWAGVGLLALDQLAEVLDVKDERDSRADLGGVGRGELALHVVLVLTRLAAVALALAARPLAAWSPLSPPLLGGAPAWLWEASTTLIPGALAATALHLWLAWRYRPALCCAPAAA